MKTSAYDAPLAARVPPAEGGDYRRNLNIVWGECCADWLAALGVRHAVVCPGSRSAPLALGFARCRDIQAISILDERSAAFYALGLARAAGMPAVLVCTSGTAAANFLPAVVEARYAKVPLVLLTADRPPELRDCAAGQTIAQNRLYADFTNWQVELALPDAALFTYLRQTLTQAFRRTFLPQAGPVHLNQPFPEPLAPTGEAVAIDLPQPPHPISVPPSAADEGPDALLAACSGKRGVIVAGAAAPCDAKAYVRGIAWLARSLNWPLLADVLSPARHADRHFPCLVSSYHALLRPVGAAALPAPERVVRFGALPTSTSLRAWLEKHAAADTWIVEAGPDNPDPLHCRSRTLPTSPETWPLDADSVPPKHNVEWLETWRRLQAKGLSVLDQTMAACSGSFEGKIPWLLARELPPESVVFLASSMPVRDAEYFWPANDRGHRFFANRGTHGIDGILSTALGLAAGLREPVHLVIGDLALAHDIGAFMLAHRFRGSLRIICINNGGGGIFENLPIAAFEPSFEEYFATPQHIVFSALPDVFGIRYHCPHTWEQLAERVREPVPAGIELIEWHTCRKQGTVRRRELLAAIGNDPTAG